MNDWTNAKLYDVAKLVLGVILFFSPWIFAFSTGVEAKDAYISGIIIAVVSIAALAAFAIWEEWVNLILGLWVLASPWILGFEGTKATPVFVVIGIIVAVLSAVELWLMHQNPPHLTAHR